MQNSELEAKLQPISEKLNLVRSEMGKSIIGQKRLIDRLLIGLLCDGHILLEGVPGLAKTSAVSALSKALQLEFKRIQFTPDLLPQDLIGTTVYNQKEGQFFVQKGPLFTNIVLADEINRAPPKVQSALLEVMQERQVTIAGQTFKTGDPFFVLATQNPIEQEGTYPLPEAQTDRFMMKVLITYPTAEEERDIAKRISLGTKSEIEPVLGPQEIKEYQKTVESIYLDDKVLNYIVDIVRATRAPQDFKIDIRSLIEYGASPRASIYLAKCAKAHALMEGKTYVTPYNVQEVAYDILRHRLILSYEAEAQNIGPDEIVRRILEKIPVP